MTYDAYPFSPLYKVFLDDDLRRGNMKIKVPGHHHHLVPFGFSRVEVVEILNALFGSIFAYGLNLTLGLLRS